MLPDDEIIDCYNTCSHCGEKQVTPQNLEIAIEQAQNAFHFLEICNQLADASYQAAHPTEQRLAPAHLRRKSPPKRRRAAWVMEKGEGKIRSTRRARHEQE
jgi:hypothetical protein